MRPSSNPDLIQALAVEVKVRRGELAITQEDLAGRIELDRPYISMIEVARKQPTLSVLHKIAAGLELTLGELMTRVETRYLAEQALRAKRTPKSKP